MELKAAIPNKSNEGKKDNEAEKGYYEWRFDYMKEKNRKKRIAMASSGFDEHNGQCVDPMMLDSGTTSHITFQIDKFTEIVSTNSTIELA